MADVAQQENNKINREEYIVNQIKRDIKRDFSTDGEGILQFNKNGYQAKIDDVLKTIDNCYKRIKG